MHRSHSLTLRITTKTHVYTIKYLLHFLLIVVSFLTYLIIFTSDKTLLISRPTLTQFLMSTIKVKMQTDSWFYSHPGHHSPGGISRCPAWHLPQVFICYPPLTIDFSCFYRDSTMTEFTFFDGKEDRWGDSMRALWGDLSICPHLDYLELPYHTPGELLSISHLKVWGDVPEPCNDMAYLLVHTGGDSEAESYGMALVWTSPHQAWVSMMEEALGTLSACISSGPNWWYVFAQLYKGSNHTPLPKDKHLGILPQGKAEESPYGQISQLKSASSYPLGHESSIQ